MSKNPPTFGDLLSNLSNLGNSFSFGGSKPSAPGTNTLGQTISLTEAEARDRSLTSGFRETGIDANGREVSYTNGQKDVDFGNLW